jgi:thiol:disulfide interchange protein DsbC
LVFSSKTIIGSDTCGDITIELLRKHIALPDHTEIISKHDSGGICEVILKAGDRSLFLYATNNYVIKGQMYSTQRQPTQEHFNEIQTHDFLNLKKTIDDAVGLTYKPEGQIRHTIYMFASPSCPHCSQVLAEIKPLLDIYHAELKILFFATDADRPSAIEAVCKRVDLDTYNARTWESGEGHSRMSCEAGIQAVDKAIAISQKLMIHSTPTFFLETGQSINGAKMTVLEQALKQ